MPRVATAFLQGIEQFVRLTTAARTSSVLDRKWSGVFMLSTYVIGDGQVKSPIELGVLPLGGGTFRRLTASLDRNFSRGAWPIDRAGQEELPTVRRQPSRCALPSLDPRHRRDAPRLDVEDRERTPFPPSRPRRLLSGEVALPSVGGLCEGGEESRDRAIAVCQRCRHTPARRNAPPGVDARSREREVVSVLKLCVRGCQGYECVTHPVLVCSLR